MRRRFITAILFTSLLAAAVPGYASAGKTVTTLPSPTWTVSATGELGSVEGKPVEAAKLGLVYLHTKEEHATQTKVWLVETLKAFDAATGKLKWSANFADPGTFMEREARPYLVSPDGTVYVTFTDDVLGGGTQIYAVGPDGKRKWKLTLSAASGSLYRLSNGNLVFASEGKLDDNGNYTGASLTLIHKDGYKLRNVSYKGTAMAQGPRVLIQTNYGGGKGSHIEALDTSLKRVFVYQLPAGSYAEVGYDAVLSDGTALIRTNLPKTGNRLLGFSPGGKLLWGRDIAGNATVSSLGDVYGVFGNGKLAVYNTKGLVKSAAFQDKSEFFISLSLLQDDRIGLSFDGAAFHALDAKTLTPEYTVRLGEDDQFDFTYTGSGTGYVTKDGKLSRIDL
ncbi:hypothetical protein PSTEL_26275 [Paenibacillus stellifer]|uniref:Pyrrolo-quinoline quinone repeat domain-containing protein n=1 Tax=Paenibacillus stellifer TaxID=169760 RepID=A0A089NB57_9BACL|nr:PQQ-binding-like beta-propeller repeat protein [Paenibacillus stellifer]AIQ66099.1 hypothetical protein PSTEL_26275 [Paenibacillus stellifer]